MTRHHRRDLLKASLGTGLLLTAAPFIARRAWADETTFQQAQRTKSITVGVANEKPYGYVDTDNKATGAIVEVLRATLAPYGITDVQAKVGAFDTLIPGLLAKRFDVIGAGMYIKPKRCQQIAFSNPLTQAGGAFAAKKGNPKNLHSLADVAKNSDAKIGTQLGTSQVDEVKQAGIPEDRVTLFSKDTEALAGLQAGRVDVIYFPDLEINELLTTSADSSLERVAPYVQILDAQGNQVFNYQALGLRKEDTDLLEAINKQLGELLANGKLLAILQPFGFSANELPPAAVTAEKLCAA